MTLGVNRESHQEGGAARESLVDINVDPASPGEPTPQVLGRRRRLSDMPTGDDDPQMPSPRPLSQPAPGQGEEMGLAPAARAGRVSLQAATATLEPPETACEMNLDEPIVESVAVAPIQAEPKGRQIRRSLGAAGGGLLAAVVGALLWAVVTAMVGVPVTWMAIGVAMLIASTARMLGRNPDRSLARLAGGLSLFACVLGNCLANGVLVARDIGLSAASVLIQISPSTLLRLTVATFHPLDLLFYGLAVYLGYRCSFRRPLQAK